MTTTNDMINDMMVDWYLSDCADLIGAIRAICDLASGHMTMDEYLRQLTFPTPEGSCEPSSN